ncbi:MAG: hypothetical protein M1825_000602 [Sarcosagium campestre]|nr:MAG: hypothetical protein M1825_000602 [Sarcosagium campestre]
MDELRPLQGKCSCGRNQYAVQLPQTPPNPEQRAQVYFSSSSSHRRHQAAPLTAFLRIPLAWYHSTTHSFYPDENHSNIRRTYTPPSLPQSKHIFCGFCGTPLSFWSEDPPEEAEYISLTLGSLVAEDLHALEERGFLPKEAAQDAFEEKDQIKEDAVVRASATDFEVEGVPWFETMVQGSRLGGVVRGSGGRARSKDGRVRVEWEIVEWDEDGGTDGADGGLAKRKIDELEKDGVHTDLEMRN